MSENKGMGRQQEEMEVRLYLLEKHRGRPRAGGTKGTKEAQGVRSLLVNQTCGESVIVKGV